MTVSETIALCRVRHICPGPMTALTTLLVLCILASLSLGRYPVPLSAWAGLIFSPGHDGVAGLVLTEVRLPRVGAAIFVGAGLSMAGAAYQGLFRNPMVSPDILGASAGAGFGAAAAILLGLGIFGIQCAAFTGGLIAVMLCWALASRLSRTGDPILTLVLVGIIVGAVFAALISLTKFTADPYSKLPAITFWLMGSLAAITPHDVTFAVVPIMIGIIPLYMMRWHLNVMAFGEEEARALGTNTRRLRTLVILCATLLTATSVAIAGIVGWVGLVIPHFARMIVGPDYRRLLPGTALLGASYMLIVDDLARNLYTTELPLGVVTALIGAPFFLWLMTRTRTGWS